MIVAVAAVRTTHYLALVVDRNCPISQCRRLSRPAEVSEVNHCAVSLPEQGVKRLEIVQKRVEGCAIAGRTDNLAVVIGAKRLPVQVIDGCKELQWLRLDLAIVPDDRLELVYWAVWVRVRHDRLRKPGYLTATVQTGSDAVLAAERL
jgi:hypothetical protein